MNYLGSLKDLLFIIILIICLLYTPAIGGCSLEKIRPRITAVGKLVHGRPFSIKVTWRHSATTESPVLYQVLYNKTSLMNHCNDPTTDSLQIAKACDQNSTREDVVHECDLTQEYNRLKVEYEKESVCVVIRMHLSSSNETCYSLFTEFNSYVNGNQVHCPVPENFKVHSFEAGKLQVIWDFSSKLVGDTALSEMSCFIHYKPQQKSTICTVEETKRVSRDFLHQNNSYIIQGLGPCCPYMVTICCVFARDASKCDSGYVSQPYHVTVAEQVPTSAPQVVMYSIQDNSLLIKWKISSSYMCIDKITAYEIEHWEKHTENCSTSSSAIKKYITNRPSDRKANITGIRPAAAHCFRIRMCNHPGCSPWGMVRSVEESEYPQISAKRTTSSPGGLTKNSIIVIVFGLSGFALVVVVVIIVMIIKTRDRQGRPRRLDEEVPDLEPAADLLDSSQSTEEMELDEEYDTA